MSVAVVMRAAIVLHYYADLSVNDIAAALHRRGHGRCVAPRAPPAPRRHA